MRKKEMQTVCPWIKGKNFFKSYIKDVWKVNEHNVSEIIIEFYDKSLYVNLIRTY